MRNIQFCFCFLTLVGLRCSEAFILWVSQIPVLRVRVVRYRLLFENGDSYENILLYFKFGECLLYWSLCLGYESLACFKAVGFFIIRLCKKITISWGRVIQSITSVSVMVGCSFLLLIILSIGILHESYNLVG